MVAIKCSKCGGIIPDGALFCPACGAPKAEESPPPSPVQQPPAPQPTYSPKPSRNVNIHGIFDMVFSKTLLVLGIALGVLLAWIGKVITTYGNDPDGMKIGILINSFGFAILGLMLIGGGIANKTLDKNVRTGMVISGALTLGMSMVATLSISNIFTTSY